MSDLRNLLAAIEDACGLRALSGRLGAREPVVLGITDAAKGALIAGLADVGRAPVIVVVPKPPRALALIEELQLWLGDTLPVLPFPERDALPYERLATDIDAVMDRLRALETLHSRQPCIMVAPAAALAQRTLARDEDAMVDLAVGAQMTPDALLMSLLRLGYRTAPVVAEPGEAARRGGIIDVLPSTGDAPLRIEFAGDRIESMRRFDVATQRSGGLVDAVTLGPAREVLDMASAARELAQRIDLSTLSPEGRERFEEELVKLEEDAAFAEEGFYVPLLASGSLLDHVPAGALLLIDEPADVAKALEEHDTQSAEARIDLQSRGELPEGLPSPHFSESDVRAALDGVARRVHFSRWAVDTREDGVAVETPSGTGARLPFAPPDAYGGRLRNLVSDGAEATARGRAIVIVSQQAERLAEVFAEQGVPASLAETPSMPEAGAIVLVHGSLPQGWRLTTSQPPLTLLTDAEVFGFVKQRRRLPRRAGAGREAFLADLSPGDYVVHTEHGIARFAGLIRRRVDEIEHEYLDLRYAQGDKLFVPAEQVDRVSRYVGPGDATPHLTRLGSQEWTRAKARVRRAVADLAKELLELYASRQLIEGHAFPQDSPWQQELEASFPYVETPDQLAAVCAVKADMEHDRPMDRVVCGDVGYGKTEVAVRAAFKAITDGRQVAMLVPTTVLAQQHYNTFRERLSGFPARVDMLSRFRSDKEQRETIEGLKDGSVDIVIGTHRLLQKDVAIKNLGLAIIDEEQRFGVAHKERLKQMRREVDVLTLSATPIPRTLHMSLTGIRDMSTMETPPEQRLPIKTYVSESDDKLVRDAIVRELERGGQVYFVHNRVQDIEAVARKLSDLVPEAAISIGHGQQPEEQLERVMVDFVDGRVDVLVCTTIIESGLDIPNVNTIIIDRADRLGLAQLYQLRGRVGRGAARAYAYLLFDKYRSLSEQAQKRLQAIFQATELGSGFQIALRDLEIRGAGNLLGAEQSGHIGAVGFDLYVRLLSDAVERLKALREGRTPPVPKTQQPSLTIDLPFSAHLPSAYVGDLNVRLALYQRMAEVESPEEAESVAQELDDRFGPAPAPARNLLFVVRIRALAKKANASAVQREGDELVVRIEDGLVPREVFAGARIPGLKAGASQARLDLGALGEGWQDALERVMTKLAQEASLASVNT
ncbi:MAG: transcription-repair coupling factor [Dehalococcoidia bacterium]